MIPYASTNQQKAEVAMLLSQKWNGIRDKDDHFVIIIKGPICQDDIITLNGYACDKRASKYIKLKLTNLKE